MMKKTPVVRSESAPITSAAMPLTTMATGQMINICVVPSMCSGAVKSGS